MNKCRVLSVFLAACSSWFFLRPQPDDVGGICSWVTRDVPNIPYEDVLGCLNIINKKAFTGVRLAPFASQTHLLVFHNGTIHFNRQLYESKETTPQLDRLQATLPAFTHPEGGPAEVTVGWSPCGWCCDGCCDSAEECRKAALCECFDYRGGCICRYR